MSRSLILLGLTSVLSMVALAAPSDSVIGSSYDPHGPGPDDDKMTITLADGSTVTDTPLNIVRRAQDGEFKLPDAKTAEKVADAHNDAVMVDPAKSSDAFIEPRDLPVAEGNDHAGSTATTSTTNSTPISSVGTTETGTTPETKTTIPTSEPTPVVEPSVDAPGHTNSGAVVPNADASAGDGSSRPSTTTSSTTDTSSAPSGPADTVEEPAAPSGPPISVNAPGASTQIGSATTPSGAAQITDDNPVIPGTNAGPRPTGIEPPAPSPDANAASAGANTLKDGTAAGVDAVYANNPRAQVGAETELTGEKALGQTSASEQSTWTPAAGLAPQTPTTLHEAEQQAALAGGGQPSVDTNGALDAAFKRIEQLEQHADEDEEQIKSLEERLSKLEARLNHIQPDKSGDV